MLQRARVMLDEQDYAEARSIAAHLLAADQNDGDALAIEGFRLFSLKHYEHAVSALRRAVEFRAQDPQAAETLAYALFNTGQFDEAKAVAKQCLLQTQSSELMNLMGVICMRHEKFDESASWLNKSLARNPKHYITIANLFSLNDRASVSVSQSIFTDKTKQLFRITLRQLLKEQSKRELTDDESLALLSLTLDSKETFEIARKEADRLYVQPLLSDALAQKIADVYFRLGYVDRTIEMRDQVKIDRYGENLALGQALIAQGGKRWLEGWTLLDDGFHRYYNSAVVHEVPAWQGERVKGDKLFVYQDQGFGDVLIGLRFLRILVERGFEPVFWMKPSLKDVVNTADGIGTLISSDERPSPQHYGCSKAVPLFGVVKRLKLEPEELRKPVFVSAPEKLTHYWKERLGKGASNRIFVGLAATGNPQRTDDWHRSVGTDLLAAFASLDNITWVNLAIDKRPEQQHLNKALSMLDPTDEINNFADTAAIIKNLDLVVAIDCSVAHLAAALGSKVIVMASSATEWRWRIGDDLNPWWPNVEVFRCARPGDWQETVLAVAHRIVEASKKASRRAELPPNHIP